MTKRTGSDLLAADVHEKLRTRILTLEIKPGSRLVEDEISAELNVGRTPVREALLRLQGEGLVSRKKGWVAEESDPADVSSIFEARVAIEGYATRLAAERVSDQDVQELRVMIDKMDELEGMSRLELNRLNRLFHEAIIDKSENSLFRQLYERTQFSYWNLRLPVLFTREQVVVANQQHRDLLAAIAAHEPDRAEQLAREHIETTFKIVTDTIRGF